VFSAVVATCGRMLVAVLAVVHSGIYYFTLDPKERYHF
jgi:hypothetical protein